MEKKSKAVVVKDDTHTCASPPQARIYDLQKEPHRNGYWKMRGENVPICAPKTKGHHERTITSGIIEEVPCDSLQAS